MGYVSTWIGDHFSALLLSLMTLQLMLVDRKPFHPCSLWLQNRPVILVVHKLPLESKYQLRVMPRLKCSTSKAGGECGSHNIAVLRNGKVRKGI